MFNKNMTCERISFSGNRKTGSSISSLKMNITIVNLTSSDLDSLGQGVSALVIQSKLSSCKELMFDVSALTRIKCRYNDYILANGKMTKFIVLNKKNREYRFSFIFEGTIDNMDIKGGGGNIKISCY